MNLKQLTNKKLAALFFAGFVLFFILFWINKYTVNVIMLFICLNLSLAFKTWDVIRDEHYGY